MIAIYIFTLLLTVTSYTWPIANPFFPLVPPRMRHAHLTPETTRIKSTYGDIIHQNQLAPTLQAIQIAEWQGLLPSTIALISALQEDLSTRYPAQKDSTFYFFEILKARIHRNNNTPEAPYLPEDLQVTGGNDRFPEHKTV